MMAHVPQVISSFACEGRRHCLAKDMIIDTLSAATISNIYSKYKLLKTLNGMESLSVKNIFAMTAVMDKLSFSVD